MGSGNTGLKIFFGFIVLCIICALVYYGIQSLNTAPAIEVTVLGSTEATTASDIGASTSAPPGKGFMAIGDTLKQGLASALYSKNNIYMIVLLNNAELQVRKGGLTLWRTNIYSPLDLKNCTARMEPTGLVIRDSSERIVWQMLTPEYVQAAGLDVQRLLLTDDGQVALADKNGKTQYRLNLFKLPALGPRSKIDDQFHLGSLVNDFCVGFNASGRVVHATCLPKLRDKAIYYAEKNIFNTGDENTGGFTSVEQTSDSKLVAKAKDKPDWVIATGQTMVVMNPAGDVQTFASWEDYMNRQPGMSQLASELIGNRIAFDTSEGVDFMTIPVPYTIKAPTNPCFMQITENGQVTLELRHIDQDRKKTLKVYPGVQGFKSAGSNAVLVFGPVFHERASYTETLNSAYICLIDPRQYDIRDAGLDYVTVLDNKGVIVNQPPLGQNEYSFLYSVNKANSMSRVIRVQTFDLMQMAQILSLDESGYIQFKDAVSGKLVGPLEPSQ